MRQLTFNLKNTSLLACRLLKGELDPSQILNMSLNELKAGYNCTERIEKEKKKARQNRKTSGGNTNKDNKTDVIVSSEIVLDDPSTSPTTPVSTVAITSLLDSKKRKRNRTGSKMKVELQDGSSITDVEKIVATSSKRKNKSLD
ncbi:hypothetical protein FXO38_24798 [Capsicum annuum]|nr:hypothetical protein FXO38_24798 [Capsicum annuum]